MQLIQILLPLLGDDRGRKRFAQVREELTERFGGVTLYRNAPAEGSWQSEGIVEKDIIVIVEVMTEKLDHDWWSNYRKTLEDRFEQSDVVIRAVHITRL